MRKSSEFNKSLINKGLIDLFFLSNISYIHGKKEYFTIKNILWVIQNLVSNDVRSIDIANSLVLLTGYQKPVQKKINMINLKRYYFAVISKNSKVLFFFEHIKNKNNLSETEKISIIDNSKFVNNYKISI